MHKHVYWGSIYNTCFHRRIWHIPLMLKICGKVYRILMKERRSKIYHSLYIIQTGYWNRTVWNRQFLSASNVFDHVGGSILKFWKDYVWEITTSIAARVLINVLLFFAIVKVELQYVCPGKPYKGNIGATGYYRVNYDNKNWYRLVKQFNSNHKVTYTTYSSIFILTRNLD